MIRRPLRTMDERLGIGPLVRTAIRYVFPDHWTFQLGEIALYSFIVLVGTGIFLTVYYVPSDASTTYLGDYEPLQGVVASQNYLSTIRISFDVPGGLLMRQTHHWAAYIFIAAILVHMARIMFTGAFRKPREINYLVGVTLLGAAIFEGFAGYMLPDDLLSGMGLVIAYAVGLSIPFVGADAMFLVWDGEYPGADAFWTRLFTMHVLIVPVLIAVLISIHLAIIMRQHHTQFPGPGRTERNTVGTPMWPGYALRSLGLFGFVAGILFLLGGLIQVNPIWLWGPYEPYLSTNGAQPDWFLGWLIGGLRIMPPLELQVGDYTVVPNAFWGGMGFPLAVFAILYAFPWIDKRFFGDRHGHELLDRPRDNPRRSAFLCAFFGWILVVFVGGATDRIFYRLEISYEAQIWVFRALTVLGPFVVYFIARRIFRELREREVHPLRAWNGTIVERRLDGGFATLKPDGEEPEKPVDAEPAGAAERED